MREMKFVIICVAAVLVLFAGIPKSLAYERYNDGCNGCHGAFDSATSPKGNTFPSDDKHEMHRASSNMNTDCDLCHTSGDGRDPFTGSSNGTTGTTGYGCVGCHGRLEDAGNDSLSPGIGAGLRQHHNNSGVATCALCHSDANPLNYIPVGENIQPAYYGSVDTKAKNACNREQVSGVNENWTIGDFEGLDNDGDALYDATADTDCATSGDLNFDGKADILWRNSSTGQNWTYLMNGADIDQSFGINTVTGSAWQIVGNGDYDGDGDADILWRNSSTGQNWMYLIDSGTIDTSVGVNTVADTAWKVVGNGDYNGDGSDDILWRHDSSNLMWVYFMAGATISNGMSLQLNGNPIPDSTWEIVGGGDYNGDDKADILWRNSASGWNWMWLMNGAMLANSLNVNTVPDAAWQIVGSGDYDGDGDSDILWRNSNTGQNWMYLMNGATIFSSVGVNTVPAPWLVAGDGDYNGDGKSDILWRNGGVGGTGQNYVYFMNGATIGSSAGINTVSDLGWDIVNVN